MNCRSVSRLLTLVTLFLLPAMIAAGQCPTSILTTDLKAPTKIISSTNGNLLVAEQGNGPNTGRISMIDVVSGARRTLIDGLPAGFAAPNNDPSGPAGLVMRGRTLYVAIGLGDAVLAGPLPNSFVPNPNPSSPILSSVLAIHLSSHTESTTSGFILSLADQNTLKSNGTVVLDNGGGDKLQVDLIVDFPDYVPEPRPGLSNAVRQSNPFGVALLGNHLYVADASSNIVRDVNLATQTFSTLVLFSAIANNRGFGPPFVEPVPDSVHLFGNQLLVSLLTGFPFPLGNAGVQLVDIGSGTTSSFISGLSSAIDVLPANGGGLLTLEFSTDMLNPAAAGRLSYYSVAPGSPVVLANCLITPTSMIQDEETRDIYVTEIFTGRVMKVTNLILPNL